MPIEPPVVWHLDSREITAKFESPADRLTIIKVVMHIFVNGKRKPPLEETLTLFGKICDNSSTNQEIISFIEGYGDLEDTELQTVLASLKT